MEIAFLDNQEFEREQCHVRFHSHDKKEYKVLFERLFDKFPTN